MSIDLILVERGNGGDLVLEDGANDFTTIEGFQNMPYLALFGGNLESSTKDVVSGEQRKDWWGNTALIEEFPVQQMNSETERTLNEIALNSQGRLVLQQAVERDLEFMQSFAQVDVLVTFEGVDRVVINIALVQFDNQQETEFTFIWNATTQELQSGFKYPTI